VSFVVLRGLWCNVIVLNAHAPSEKKGDDSKDSFYEAVEQAYSHFRKYHMKILLGYCFFFLIDFITLQSVQRHSAIVFDRH
jgi:hypothetical protein